MRKRKKNVPKSNFSNAAIYCNLVNNDFQSTFKVLHAFLSIRILVNYSSPTFLKTLIKKLMMMKMNCSCRTVDQRRILSYIFIRKLLP